MPVSRARLREIAARSRLLMTHEQRLAECKKRRPDFEIVTEKFMLTARWTEHGGPAKQTITRMPIGEELLVRACLVLIMGDDDARERQH